MRGKQTVKVMLVKAVGITPAYAGKTANKASEKLET